MKQIVTATWAWWGFLVGLCLLAHGSRAQGLATLRGTVADSLSGQPLVGVSVGLQGRPGGTATDALGNFRLAGLAPGTYLVRVGALGYRSAAQAVTVGASGNPHCTLCHRGRGPEPIGSDRESAA